MGKVKFDKTRDYIYVIAPASMAAGGAEKNLGTLESFSKIMSEQGFRVKYDKDIFSGDVLPFCAASKEFRAKDFNKAWTDEEVKIIWAFRGGYGSAEICDDIKLEPATGKMLIGFSDITSLHCLLNKNKIPTLHASVSNHIVSDESGARLKDITEVLEGKDRVLDLKKMNDIAIDAEVKSSLIGGNLTVFTSMVGTKSMPDTAGKILIFEEIGERGYQIQRYLTQIKNAGLFDKVTAIIFADFLGGNEKDGSNYVIPALEAFAKESGKPCYRVGDIGHGEKNIAITMGGEVTLSDGKLLIESPFEPLGDI